MNQSFSMGRPWPNGLIFYRRCLWSLKIIIKKLRCQVSLRIPCSLKYLKMHKTKQISAEIVNFSVKLFSISICNKTLAHLSLLCLSVNKCIQLGTKLYSIFCCLDGWQLQTENNENYVFDHIFILVSNCFQNQRICDTEIQNL